MNPPALVTYLWPNTRRQLVQDLIQAPVVHTGEWQAMDTSTSKHHGTHEMEDVTIVVPRIPSSMEMPLSRLIPADHEWADEHFAERVSGIPHNPAPSHVRWPYAVAGNVTHMRTQAPAVAPPTATYGTLDDPGDPVPTMSVLQFDHTYPERFWPKHVNHNHESRWGDDWTTATPVESCPGRRGLRFNYGDLGDVVALLVRSPMTRQAYLPVWFPEDTGAVDKQRVPCTLGYHFMIRNGFLSCRYFIRSCDVYRHLDNDIYLACLLTQWVTDQYNAAVRYATGREFTVLPGRLVMYISSLHLFQADAMKLIDKRPDHAS